jgi:hypothetical protein
MHHLVHQVCDGCRMDIYKVTGLLGHAKLVTTVLGTPQAKRRCRHMSPNTPCPRRTNPPPGPRISAARQRVHRSNQRRCTW